MKDLGHFSYFLGLEITYFTNGLYITQAKYASKFLSWSGLTNSKVVDTLVELNVHLTPSARKPLFNLSLYKRLVGSLVYLIVTRPDISYAIHQVSQFLYAPRSTHYAANLSILRYLKGTLFHGFSTLLSLLLFSVYSLMLIGQEIPLIKGQPPVIVFFLVLFWFLSEARNKPL